MNNNASRTQYSPVVCWASDWNNTTLKIKKINKESSVWQKAFDRKKVEETWKR